MTGQIIYSVKGESDELKAAVTNAQATFKFFWRETAKPMTAPGLAFREGRQR